MSLARNFLTLGSGTALSRLLGFARDILIAATLGSGPMADAFVVAFRLPNLFRRLVSEGAFNSAFVPIYAHLRETEGRSAAQAFAAEVFTGLAGCIVLLVLAAEIFMRPLVFALAPGFFADPEKAALAVFLSRLAFPFLGFALLSALFSGLLNAAEQFFVVSFAPVTLNLVLIGALVLATDFGLGGSETAAIWLCIGVSIGGFVQSLWCYGGLAGAHLRLRWRRPRMSLEMRRLLVFILPGVLAGGITQINAFIGSLIGSASPGVVSYLYYADRVYQLPLGMVGVALGLALLPQLSRLLASGDEQGARNAQNNALEFALFLTLPAAVALSVGARPIVEVLFQRGAFGPDATLATASALRLYAFGLPAFIIAKALQPSFFAAHQMRAPTLIALIGAALDVAISLTTFASLAQTGIALAAAAAGWFNAFALGILLWRTGRWHMERALIGRLARLALCAALMGLFVHFISAALTPHWQAAQPLVIKLGALGLIIFGGMAVFILLCRILNCLNWRAWVKTA